MIKWYLSFTSQISVSISVTIIIVVVTSYYFPSCHLEHFALICVLVALCLYLQTVYRLHKEGVCVCVCLLNL